VIGQHGIGLKIEQAKRSKTIEEDGERHNFTKVEPQLDVKREPV
jgi:hypothetical protein